MTPDATESAMSVENFIFVCFSNSGFPKAERKKTEQEKDEGKKILFIREHFHAPSMCQ